MSIHGIFIILYFIFIILILVGVIIMKVYYDKLKIIMNMDEDNYNKLLCAVNKKLKSYETPIIPE